MFEEIRARLDDEATWHGVPIADGEDAAAAYNQLIDGFEAVRADLRTVLDYVQGCSVELPAVEAGSKTPVSDTFERFRLTYAGIPFVWNADAPPPEVLTFMLAARDLGTLLFEQPLMVIESPEALSELTEATPWALVQSRALSMLAVGANAAVNHLNQIATVRSAADINADKSQVFDAMIGAMYQLENKSRLAHGLPALPSRLKL